MNKNDQKIRKHWLVTWGFVLAFAFLNNLLAVLFYPALNAISQIQYLSIAFGLVGTLAFGYITYRCVYKRPGTKLLIFCLIMTSGSLLINPILLFTGHLNIPTYIPYSGIIFLASQGAGVLWFIACWRMLKVNKKLKADSQLAASHEISSP